MMVWVFGVGEMPISVSNHADDGTLDFTVQAVGATSAAIVDADVGDSARAARPIRHGVAGGATAQRNAFVMAGGLGLAPLRMAIDAMVDSERPPRSLTILVGARQPVSLLYPDDLARWATSGATVARRSTRPIAPGRERWVSSPRCSTASR